MRKAIIIGILLFGLISSSAYAASWWWSWFPGGTGPGTGPVTGDGMLLEGVGSTDFITMETGSDSILME